jgi:acyl carrier protein
MAATNAERVRKIIGEHLGRSEFPDTAELVELGADSLDFIELVLSFEEEFQIEIRDEEAQAIHGNDATVAAVITLVEETIVREANSRKRA